MPKIAFIAQIWPEHCSSGGGVRTFSLVKACLSAGWQISFLATSKPNRYSDELKALGVEIYQIEANNESFSELLKTLHPDLVIFDRFMTEEQYGWRIREALPQCLRVLDTIDLHFLRRSRASGELDDTLYREMASIYRSDLTLLISSFEFDYLQREYQLSPELLGLVPFFYPPSISNNSFSERQHFLFLGNYRHAPNLDAAHYLVKEIWPHIRKKLPKAEIHLYGAYPPKEVADLHNEKNGIYFRGQAEDQYRTFEKYRVNLAPLRFGAGLKGKIADGWSVGTPCVSTPIGSEAMSVDENWGGIIATDPLIFAEAASSLHESQDLWLEKSNRGQALNDSLFSLERESQSFIKMLEQTLEKKEVRRSKNFLGSLLWHHSLQSTKYFSKWIEAKNKKAP